MIFVSYAQNFEDMILNRALNSVTKGFYIDIGATDPIDSSITKAFYEKGWRGMNIQALDADLKLIMADRPEDINLNIAIADYNGDLDLFVIKDASLSENGLSTTNADYAAFYRQAGYAAETRRVNCRSLDVVFVEHKIQEVHFINIDVERCEKKVIEGLFLTNIRPWIIVIASTQPGTSEDTSFEWEHIILENSYQLVYFDGLNKFYLSYEHSDLKSHFETPPNYFDHFITYSHLLAQQKVVALSEEVQMLKNQLEENLAKKWQWPFVLRNIKKTVSSEAIKKDSFKACQMKPAVLSQKSRVLRFFSQNGVKKVQPEEILTHSAIDEALKDEIYAQLSARYIKPNKK